MGHLTYSLTDLLTDVQCWKNLVILMLGLQNMVCSIICQYVRDLIYFLSHLLICSLWLKIEETLNKSVNIDARTRNLKFSITGQQVRDKVHHFSSFAHLPTRLLWLKILGNREKSIIIEESSSLFLSYTHMLACLLVFFGSKFKETEINLVNEMQGL